MYCRAAYIKPRNYPYYFFIYRIKYKKSEIPYNIGINVDMNIQRTYLYLNNIIHRHRKITKTNKTNGEIELLIGKDISYEEGKVETVTLSEMLSELFTAFILDDYVKLKEKAPINENAYYKLEIIKSLFNYFKNLKLSSQSYLYYHHFSDVFHCLLWAHFVV